MQILFHNLKNVQVTTLQTINELFFGDVISFFKEKYSSNERDQYINDFRNLLTSINVEDEDKVVTFANGQENISQEYWNPIYTNLNNNKKYFESTIFKKSLDDLIKTSYVL